MELKCGPEAISTILAIIFKKTRLPQVGTEGESISEEAVIILYLIIIARIMDMVF